MKNGRWLFLLLMATVLGLMFIFAGINVGYYLDIPAIILVNGVAFLAALIATAEQIDRGEQIPL